MFITGNDSMKEENNPLNKINKEQSGCCKKKPARAFLENVSEAVKDLKIWKKTPKKTLLNLPLLQKNQIKLDA